MTKLSFLKDSIKTVIGSLIIAFGLQLIAYPFIVNKVGNTHFGEILNIYTILTLASVVLGNTLNNIRLINMARYDPRRIYRNFRYLLGISILVESVLLAAVLVIFYNENLISILLLVVINMLMCLRIYLNVFYRMLLHYNKILFVAVFQFLGLLVGLLFYQYINYWELIFLASEIVAMGYIIFSLRHHFITREITNARGTSPTNDYLMLLGTNFLNNISIYLDRLILLPLIGGSAVTLAFLATFIGKMLATFLYPVNNVILSYISVNNVQNKTKQYFRTLILGTLFSIIVLVICYPLTIFIVEKIYQQNSAIIKPYILIGNMGMLFSVIGNIVQSLNVKFISISIQTIFQVVFVFVYVISELILTYFFGLTGFFIGVLLLNFIKMIFLAMLGIKYSKERIG